MPELLTVDKYSFVKVGTIPVGYKVWSIPSIGVGNIPLCKGASQKVDTDSLLYIKVTPKEWELLRHAAGRGINDLASCQRAYNYKRRGPISDFKRKIAGNTINIFKKYSK